MASRRDWTSFLTWRPVTTSVPCSSCLIPAGIQTRNWGLSALQSPEYTTLGGCKAPAQARSKIPRNTRVCTPILQESLGHLRRISEFLDGTCRTSQPTTLEPDGKDLTFGRKLK